MTTTTKTTFTKDDVIAILPTLDRNRSNGGACYYRLPLFDEFGDPVEGAVASEPHCIAANIVATLGLPLPELVDNSEIFNRIADKYWPALTPDAVAFITELQTVADGNDSDFYSESWGDVIDYVLSRQYQ